MDSEHDNNTWGNILRTHAAEEKSIRRHMTAIKSYAFHPNSFTRLFMEQREVQMRAGFKGCIHMDEDYDTTAKTIIHNVCEQDYKYRGEEAGKIKTGNEHFIYEYIIQTGGQ